MRRELAHLVEVALEAGRRDDLALDFWTWERLAREGFTERAAAKPMASLVAVAAERG